MGIVSSWPTVVFGHHPVTAESGLTNLAGPNFVLNRSDALTLQQNPNITVFGLGLGRADMLFVGVVFAGAASICNLAGWVQGARQRRLIREEAYATA